ncbi:uncharacterized protein LOC116173445 [Photinus pyralis]|uniref:uncharacterized protein LOC116173445 n=1 Tax=Photinus pyralis TaxID=7054 RepID=UPI0012672F20|nr:uncharacterized protein LOC116173445 [Photinus pyralis]
MPGNICHYYRCGKKKATDGVILHQFPVQDVIRLQRWIINSGNVNLLNLEKSKLANRFICGEHFADKDFMNANHLKLLKSAIPIPYCNATAPSVERCSEQIQNAARIDEEIPFESRTINQDRSTLKVYGKPSLIPSPNRPVSPKTPTKELLDEISQMPSPNFPKRKLFSSLTHQNEKVITKLMSTQQKLRNHKVRVSRLRKTIKTARKINTTDEIFRKHQFSSLHSRTLACMQLRKTRASWTLAEKNFSIMLFYKSPAAYDFLRSIKVILPSPSTNLEVDRTSNGYARIKRGSHLCISMLQL